MSGARDVDSVLPLKDVRQGDKRPRLVAEPVSTVGEVKPLRPLGLGAESTSGAALGRLCEVCAYPVPDDVVPAETIAGGLQLECMSCWMNRMEERMTLHPKPADL